MTALGLGDIERFPFVEPPDSASDQGRRRPAARARRAAARTRPAPHRDRHAARPAPARPAPRPHGARGGEAGLRRRGARHRQRALDPGPARAPDRQAGAGRPAARALRRPDERLPVVPRLWRYLREQQEARSGNQFRRMCRDEYLHYLRIREWQDVHSQLRQACKDLGIEVGRLGTADGAAADPAAVHRALIAGLLSHVGLLRPGAARLPRRSRRALGDPSRVGALAQAAGVRGGGRAGRDLPAVRPRGRTRRPRSGRGGRRATSCSAATPSRAGRRSARR